MAADFHGAVVAIVRKNGRTYSEEQRKEVKQQLIFVTRRVKHLNS
jgi:hypothetical protein